MANIERSGTIMQTIQRIVPLLTLTVLISGGTPLPAVGLDSDLQSGKQLLAAGQFGQALKRLDVSVDRDPTCGDLHYWRAKCLQAMHRTKDACAEFRLALMLSTDANVQQDSKVQLGKNDQALPAKTIAQIAGDQKTDKVFKLQSNKLDWNLNLDQSFLSSIQTQNANLIALAQNGLPTGTPEQPKRLPLEVETQLSNGPVHSCTLSQRDLAELGSSDIAIILDRSGSMEMKDCPGTTLQTRQSRLSWATEEMGLFADKLVGTRPVLRHGLTLITFDTTPSVYQIGSASELHQQLLSLRSGGGTRLAPALLEAFREHQGHSNQPLLIAVITDAEIDVQSTQATIAEATRNFPLPHGVFVTILQVGAVAEQHTAKTLASLDNLTATAGAAYDACAGIPFSRLRQDGMGQDLLVALHASKQAQVSSNPAGGGHWQK